MSATTGDGSIRRAENCFHPILLRRQCPRFFYHWLRWAPDIGSFLSARKRKPPQTEICGGSYREPGDDLLSLEIQPTIIGAEAFHCPVRNGKEWDRHAMVTRLKKGGKVKHSSFRAAMQSLSNSLEVFSELFCSRLHGYRIKLHEQLVLVSSTPHSACTSNLSTSWSRTTLQGGLASRKTYLQAGFPLRCFQRLSFPHIATRRCHWRDNRYTRGESTPVLSY